MSFIKNSKYYFPNITIENRRRLDRAFKQRLGKNSDLFKIVLEIFKLPEWFVDTLLHQLGYILQRNPKDVLGLNSGSCDLMCRCSHRSAALHFPGALDAVVSHAVKGLLQNLIEDPDEFGWILDRHANEAVEIAINDFKANSMLQASSALPSSDLPSSDLPSAALPSSDLPSAALLSSALPSAAAAASAALPDEIYD